MDPQQRGGQFGHPCNQPLPCNQPRPNPQILTEQKVKELVMDMLIELNVIARTEKKKGLPDV